MKDKKALSVLREHKKILDNKDFDNCFLWQQQALSYVERFLGSDSIEYKLMSSFHFPDFPDKDYNNKLLVIKHQLLRVTEQCIETVKNIGIKRVYHNFLCKYSDKELIAGIVAVAGALFTAGIFIAKNFLK